MKFPLQKRIPRHEPFKLLFEQIRAIFFASDGGEGDRSGMRGLKERKMEAKDSAHLVFTALKPALLASPPLHTAPHTKLCLIPVVTLLCHIIS